jgi:uncharacterized protein YndB with AHSA1/START domain
MTHLVGPGALRLVRHLPGPADRAWAHLVDPERRAAWLAGGAFEPRVGGGVTLAFRHADLTDPNDPPPDPYRAMAEGGHEARGVVTAWDPPRRLAHTWEDDAEASEVAFELQDEGDEVRLALVHRRLDTRAAVVSVAAGWDAHLELLAAVLAGVPRPAYWRAFVAGVERHAGAFAGRAEADGRPPGFATLRALAGGGHRLEYARAVAAPVAAVWRALAEPEVRDRWYPAELRFEGPVGGWARERFPDDPTPLPEGRLTAWAPERRLAFVVDGDPTSPEPSVREPQSVEVDLAPDGPATRVAFAYGFGERALAADVGAGWHACLDALTAVAEGREAATDTAALRRGYAAWLAEPFGDPERRPA